MFISELHTIEAILANVAITASSIESIFLDILASRATIFDALQIVKIIHCL